MSNVAVRTSSRLADMLDWLESSTGLPVQGGSFIRVENFTEDDHAVIRAEIPGVDPNRDIKLEVQDDFLTIAAERREEKHDRQHSEFRYGAFSRTVRLPQHTDPDEVSATYKDGILEVHFPVSRPSSGPRPIPVQRLERGAESAVSAPSAEGTQS